MGGGGVMLIASTLACGWFHRSVNKRGGRGRHGIAIMRSPEYTPILISPCYHGDAAHKTLDPASCWPCSACVGPFRNSHRSLIKKFYACACVPAHRGRIWSQAIVIGKEKKRALLPCSALPPPARTGGIMWLDNLDPHRPFFISTIKQCNMSNTSILCGNKGAEWPCTMCVHVCISVCKKLFVFALFHSKENKKNVLQAANPLREINLQVFR